MEAIVCRVIVKTMLGLLLLFFGIVIFAPYGKRKKKGFYGLAAFAYAHRGLHDISGGIPENSLSAFRLAVEHGYGAELDVHLTRDGRLAVMHDESLLRTVGVKKNLCDCTARELAGYCLQGTQEPIPFLEDVLPIFAGKTPLVIELKPYNGNHAALTKKICELLEHYPTLLFCVESFDPRVLLWLKKYYPKILRGQLSENFIQERSVRHFLPALVLTNLYTNCLTMPDFIAYRFSDRKRISLKICRKLWGVQEFSWTLRSAEDIKKARREDAIPIFELCRPE